MKDHEQRVVDEKSELDEKISKLVEFMKTELYLGLHKVDISLLSVQFEYMNDYSRVLGQRIDRFK